MSVTRPDRKAVFVNDPKFGPCFRYKANIVANSLSVHPHVWHILHKFDDENHLLDFPPSKFVNCIQNIRFVLSKKPQSLKTHKIIIKDIHQVRIVYNSNNGLLEFYLEGSTDPEISKMV